MVHLRPAVLSLALLVAGSVVCAPHAADAAAPDLDIDVHGTGVVTYPAFDPAIQRYGITTTSGTAGTVTVSVAPGGGTVQVNGRPAPDGQRTLTGLRDGDEISVLVTSGGTTTPYSFVYLPVDFPELQRVELADDNPSPGSVMLTLGLFTSPSMYYETAVDPNGVPSFVHATTNSMDLKPVAGGGYSVFRPTTAPGRTGADLVILDERFEEVRRVRTTGLVNTDGHDAIVEDDGSTWLVSYERRSHQDGWDPGTPNWEDSVIQHVAADGQVLFEWSSAAHVPETTYPVVPFGSGMFDQDYSHINSIQVVDDGAAVLASFRHLSSVFKIAVTDHGPYKSGEVIWKLGGRDNDFAFQDALGVPVPAEAGPCAQHTAYEVAEDRILVFDNGAFAPKMCVDPADPAGAAVARTPTRIAEWEIDETTHEAKLVWEYHDDDRTAIFAGSSQRLDNGNTLVGWASANVGDHSAIATEVDADGTPVWELRDPIDRVPGGSSQGFFTYRAFKAEVPDAQDPVVTVESPAEGATYQLGATPEAVVADCTDRGGSSLRSCVAPTTLPTGVAGTHSYAVTATDGAGNTTTVTRTYTVLAPSPTPTTPTPPTTPPTTPAGTPGRPDAQVRTADGRFTGVGRYDWSGKHRRAVSLDARTTRGTAWVKVVNRGEEPARFALTRTADSRTFRATLTSPDGVRRSPLLAPGQAWTIRVRVERTGRARQGDERVFLVRVRSTTDASLRDAVAVHARAVR